MLVLLEKFVHDRRGLLTAHDVHLVPQGSKALDLRQLQHRGLLGHMLEEAHWPGWVGAGRLQKVIACVEVCRVRLAFEELCPVWTGEVRVLMEVAAVDYGVY